MHSAFNIEWPGQVSKHDVVYLTPPNDPTQGMPIGNGDVGALCWCEDSRLILVINKCDLWDKLPSGDSGMCRSILRHGCRIIIDFSDPIFDIFYLSDFSGRISLADASIEMDLSGAFGLLSFKAFVNSDDSTLCCDVDSRMIENNDINITIERYGSRTYPRWYAVVDRSEPVALNDSEASADSSGIYVSKKISSGEFAAGCRILGDGDLNIENKRKNSHSAKAVISGDAKKFSLIAAVVSPSDNDPVDQTRKKLDAAQSAGIDNLFAAHKSAWKSFWMRSLMQCGDDYLDNLWHLTMYYANSSQRGKYPGRFLNSLWSWNRDVQHWSFYFHWNQQETYWPLNAAGHHDLLNSYLDYRFNSLPRAREDAKNSFGTKGAFVSDVADCDGYNSLAEGLNHTPVAQIAMDFWRQYRYTGDIDFLKSKALPYMLEAARFFETLFVKEDDGKYHAKEGTAYEGWIKLKDGITELSSAKALFSAVLTALSEAGIEDSGSSKWNDIVENIAPLPTVCADKSCIDGHLKRGMFKGDKAASDRILAAGFGIDEKKILTSMIPCDITPNEQIDIQELIQDIESNRSVYSRNTADMKLYDGIFPSSEHSAIFPSGQIGLNQKNSDYFNAAINTVKLHTPDLMGFDTLPVALARLGLSDELWRVLKQWPARWQFYCNGFGHYGPRDIQKSESSLRFRTNLVADVSLPIDERDNHKFPFPSWPFRHMGMESMSVLATALNESLLQSYDGIIWVAPAILDTTDARFTLHAVGGFVVSAEIVGGRVSWISILSQRGGKCVVENPWQLAFITNNDQKLKCESSSLIEFDTAEGIEYTIVPNENGFPIEQAIPIKYEANSTPKTSSDGRATLGLPRMF